MHQPEVQSGLSRLKVGSKNGDECFRSDGRSLGYSLLDFWKWSVSDLVSNATRGRLAEFIVARALGISTAGVRDEWAAYDLITTDGTRIEVKSAAFIQTWSQKRHSPISFRVKKSRAWDPETNILVEESKHQADVYVFALLTHKEQSTIDPLDLSQWRFYVLATSTLEARTRSQHSITLKSLEGLCGAVEYHALGELVQSAAKLNE